ncbi:hypothetical protein DFJ74DRAFT_679433 [Hyaloraphidium curvatum]|nr:hypothetical protein DFJ74DRAFT_679433 [Hyaloraphidium curvatum]
MRTTAVFAVALLALAATGLVSAQELGNGWGASYDWQPNMEAARAAAVESNKPIMAVLWSTGCGACKALKPQFAASKDIAEASRNVVMVEVSVDGGQSDDSLAPDGHYVPRIVFMGPSGNLLDVTSGHPKFKHWWNDPTKIAEGMRSAGAAVTSGVREEL